MHCKTELTNCEWWTQGQQFSNDFKVLPLSSYDIILGYDWLTQLNPMTVDWSKQTMHELPITGSDSALTIGDQSTLWTIGHKNRIRISTPKSYWNVNIQKGPSFIPVRCFLLC